MTKRAPVPLSSLFDDAMPDALANLRISGLCLDSRRVQAGDAFVALQGEKQNGLAFIAQARQAGAVVVIVDAQSQLPGEDIELPVLAVAQLAQKLPALARSFYADPSARLHMLGVTGTNGKTSCAWFYAHWVAQLQQTCGMLGTLGYGVVTQAGAQLEATGFTTPDVFSLQRVLAEFLHADCERVAMEVSSHALAQARVAEISFDTAIFTNLSRDHLDYHKDMHSYALAKRKLFATPGLQRAVVNLDDQAGRELLASLPESVTAISYSLSEPGADLYARDIETDLQGISATVVTPAGEGRLYCKFPGLFNLANMLAVLAALQAEGFALSALLDCAGKLPYVPGRMQRVSLPGEDAVLAGFAVFIDYAHTPDALENALIALKPQVSGLLRLVFGAGGDRDTG
ncbi:MAG: UDP-N-acetylmuramoyl-L-alanyl-D-glutamate--2,6-diaminopimelate ligase, partial [Gammaproteobacteria bacterium]|nr:UDP-N-acetylmuramoyl-L-alanyl-D-glutamate--2,6-diaminopimelate ligase [Gammaproteobacteria bacterium]